MFVVSPSIPTTEALEPYVIQTWNLRICYTAVNWFECNSLLIWRVFTGMIQFASLSLCTVWLIRLCIRLLWIFFEVVDILLTYPYFNMCDEIFLDVNNMKKVIPVYTVEVVIMYSVNVTLIYNFTLIYKKFIRVLWFS